MLDQLATKVKDKVRKGVIPKKMKIVIVLGNEQEHQYIVQSRYYTKVLKIKRPGQRILLETELAAASRLIELAVGVSPAVPDVVILDSDGAGTNKVSYVFWFAPADFNLGVCEQLQGYVLELKEQLLLEREWLLRAEARIAFDLFMKALEQYAKGSLKTV